MARSCGWRGIVTAAAVMAAALTLGTPGPARAQLAFTYTLTNSGDVTVNSGGAGQTTITATIGTGSGRVDFNRFTVSGLPAGATATFSPASACSLSANSPTCSSTLTITTALTGAGGQFPITVTGSPRQESGVTNFRLTVNQPFDYALAANPPAVSVTAGGAPASTTITATLLTGATQPVSFSASGLPAGATAVFAQPSCSPTCSTTLTITAGPSTSPGNFTITVTGNPLGRTTAVALTVIQPFNYALAANPPAVSVTAGGAPASTTITATLLTGATQPVSFSTTGLPAGATAAFSQPSCSPTCSTTLTITAGPTTSPGNFTITVTGNPLGRTTAVALAVNQPFNYSLASSASTLPVIPGGAPVSTTITATLLSGTPQPVSFATSALPVGISASFSAASCSPTCSTTLTLFAGPATSPGNITITVIGNPLGRTTTVTLAVAVRTISIVSGNNQTGVINAPLPKPLVVSVTPPEPSVTVVWQVTGGAIPSATSTPTVNGLAQITLTLGPTPSPVTVTASISGTGVAASVTFVVNDATQAAVAGLKTFSVLGNLAVTTATVQARNVGLRLAALRRGSGGGVSVSGLSVNVAGQSVPLEAVTTVLGAGASADGANPFGGLGIFLNGQGTFGDQDGTRLEPGFTFHSEGLTLGSDYRLGNRFVVGAAAGYLNTTSTLDQAGGRVKLRGYSVSAFGSFYEADRFYVDAIATYGWNDYGVTRPVTFADTGATAKSDPDGRQIVVSLSAGYNVTAGALTLSPTARVNYINVRINGFEERGADIFNLRVRSQQVESLATDLGAQLSYAISTPWGVLSPLARAEWEHEFKGGSRLITGSLSADPLGTLFGAPTNTPDRDYLNLAGGLTATLPRGVSAFAHYETVLGRAHVTTHSFTAGLRLQFE